MATLIVLTAPGVPRDSRGISAPFPPEIVIMGTTYISVDSLFLLLRISKRYSAPMYDDAVDNLAILGCTLGCLLDVLSTITN